MLKNEKGLLPKVESRRGTILPEEIRDRVINFYQSDKFSRMSPGKKEFVSVKIDGVKQHMQKCVSLINLKELHLQLKKATDIKIGFSKICELRPKWGIPVGSASGAHSVCVCEYHQNAKLMVFAIPGVTDYKDLIEIVVCDIENRDCMLHSCENCPSIDELKNFLTTKFEEIDNKDVKFKQWKKEEKNKTNLLSLEMSVEEFISLQTNRTGS